MNKKTAIIAASVAGIILVGLLIYMNTKMRVRQEENEQMIEVLKMDKAEMENEYEQFAMQYNEMMAQINNDSLINQLAIEQERVQKLLEELRQTKAENTREIIRLKKELATLRAILKDYVMQIDSLNRENQALKVDNDKLRNQNQLAKEHITTLSTQNEELVDKVAIASQLNATGISAMAHNKRGKDTDKIRKAKKFVVSFTLARNVTTETGMRSIYVRIATPTGSILTNGGTFQYENRDLQYSILKEVEYNGEELPVTVYWDIAESLTAGQYRVDIFADGQNIGTTTFEME
ncbi:MAG: hypothetical protein IJC23_06850 [Bacteroidaceae bacterium]|nr:hypothetical protein [Bacteroidaceae bacterium]MBR3982463.1 hypothetical protein [Bacteroidaceae bacterium]